MSDILPEPEDFGAPLASEAHTSFGGQLAAEWANTLDPKNSLSGGYLVRRAREGFAGGFAPHDFDELPGASGLQAQGIAEQARAAIPDTPIEDARTRIKQEGLEKDVHLPAEQPSIKSPVLDLMIQEAHDRRGRDAAIARGSDSFFPNALGFVTSMGVGMIDPVNAAAFSIPVLGEARVASLVARAGDSLITRAGVKAGIGATQGAAGTAILQPADWWLHTRDGQDYTFAEALRSVVMGAGIGAVAHSGFGAIGDVRARLRGAPLAGSPQDLLLRGLMTGRHIPGEALADEGISAEDLATHILGESPAPPRRAPHQVAAVVADLPPAAQEDAVHAAMADAIAGTEPRAAEMLNVAADHEPRIAESFDAWHGSPHDFDRFDIGSVGSGEGAQAYGHGLYFAENEAVASDYRKALSIKGYDSGHPAGSLDDNATYVAAGLIDRLGGREAAIAEAAAKAKAHSDPFNDRVASILKSDAQIPPLHSGKLYKVRINANHEHFLDWDKPISEQHPHVREALLKVANDIVARDPADAHDIMHAISSDERADTFYERLADALKTMKKSAPDKNGFYTFDKGHASASETLRKAGLPGIKYLDQGSRAVPVASNGHVQNIGGKFHVVDDFGVQAGPFNTLEEADESLNPVKRTRNFVVFDDKHIEITHKNGEAVSIAQLRGSPEARTEAAGQPKIPDLVTAPKPRGRAAAHPDTLSLNEHLASKGGLKPDPELQVIYGNPRGPFVPGFGPLIRKSGMSLDQALSSAKQHGYMSDPHDIDNGTAGTRGREGLGLIQRDLLDHLDAENRGRKLYKPGHEAATKYDPEQEKHVIMGALETELEKSGAKVSDIDPKLLDRTVEIVHREGTSDVMEAYERAIMEDAESYDAIANARRSDPATADIPGFDKPADAGAAPGDGRAGARDGGQAGRSEQGAGQGDGAQPPRSRGRDLAAAAADPRWRELADVKPDYDAPDVLEESRAADHVEEAASAGTPERALTALEAEAKRAEDIWKQIEPTLTEKERALVNDVLDQLKLDKDARDKIITDGVACLVGAIG